MKSRSAAPILAALLLASSASPAGAEPRWSADFRLGVAWNLPMPLLIRQEGAAELRVRARWRSRALRPPLYYAVRVARREDGAAWAVDLTHHKIYLADPPPEVEEFAISHGFNLFTLQRSGGSDEVDGGLGVGVVIAHPENQVRGRRLDEGGGILGTGYHLAGPTIDARVAPAPPTGTGAFATVELRLTVSYARVPVAGGTATVPNAALHLTAGAGWAESR